MTNYKINKYFIEYQLKSQKQVVLAIYVGVFQNMDNFLSRSINKFCNFSIIYEKFPDSCEVAEVKVL